MVTASAATSALGKATGTGGRNETVNQRVKRMAWTSSLSEKPRSHGPRRLAEWLNPTGARKVHSLCDKIYKPKNLVMAWERVKANRGTGGVDGQSVEAFEKQ